MKEKEQMAKNSWDVVEVEYNAALEQYRHYTTLRRQDMAFVTTVQVAVFTIIGKDIQHLNFSYIVLSILAFLVLFLGLNSEIRLSAYMMGYKERAKEIEEEYNLSAVRSAVARVKQVEKSKYMLSNRVIFPFYYLVFGLIWTLVWAINLF